MLEFGGAHQCLTSAAIKGDIKLVHATGKARRHASNVTTHICYDPATVTPLNLRFINEG